MPEFYFFNLSLSLCKKHVCVHIIYTHLKKIIYNIDRLHFIYTHTEITYFFKFSYQHANNINITKKWPENKARSFP